MSYLRKPLARLDRAIAGNPRSRLALSGWRVIEQVPSGAWRHAMDAGGFYKTREDADVVAARLRDRYARLGHTRAFGVEFTGDTGSVVPRDAGDCARCGAGGIHGKVDCGCCARGRCRCDANACPCRCSTDSDLPRSAARHSRRNPAKGRDWQDVERRIEEMAAAATDEAHRMMMSGRAPDGVYLYVVPSTATAWGRLLPLTYADPVPPRAELVLQHRLPENKDRTGLRAFIRERIRRLPLLPTGDA